METTVKIIWDEPQDENWLCPENIQIALSDYCTNTKFQVTKAIPIEPPVIPVMVDCTDTYEPCKHLNGFYSTIPKRIGSRREVFCCDDCCEILDRKTLERV